MHESISQNYYSDFYERSYPAILNNCVQSPVVHGLFTHKEYPVRHSTGQIDIQIPVYELNMRSVSFPLGITYNSSGIKIQDNPGIIGYGWSMNNDFKISRMIRGKDDLEFPVIENHVHDFYFAYPYGSLYADLLHRIAPVDIHNKPFFYEANKIDGQYDIFRVELPNLNTAFILEYYNGLYTARTFKPSPVSIKLLTTNKQKTNGYLVSRYTDLYGIVVTDDDGTRYLFGETQQRDSPGSNDYTEYSSHYVTTNVSKTGWMLRQIILPTGEIINFSYKDAVDYMDFRAKVKTSVHHLNFLIRNNRIGSLNDLLILRGDPSAMFSDENNISYRMNLIGIREKNEGSEQEQSKPEAINSKLIRRISSSVIELEFNYDSIQKIVSTELLPSNPSYHRQNLSSLKIYSIQDGIRHEKVKEINFYSNEGFLDSLSSSGNGKYKFLYDRRDKNFTTEQFEKAIDWWGYCNGKNNISSLPLNDSNGDAASKRETDTLFTKVRSLKMITYPTGGNVRINYGTHRLRDGSHGAGLRVESLETFDPSSGTATTKRFKYENPKYTGIPYSLLNHYRFSFRTHMYAGKNLYESFAGKYTLTSHGLAYEVDIDALSTFIFPSVHTPYTSFNVWYEKVTEENDEGKIEYNFEYTPFERDNILTAWKRNNTMCQEEPLLVEQHTFVKNQNGNFDLIKSVKNQYMNNFSAVYEVNIVNSYQEISTYDGIYRTGTLRDAAFDDYGNTPQIDFYSWAMGQVFLVQTTETTYFPNDSITTRVRYRYDVERPYNIIAKNTFIDNLNDIINQNYFYSNHILPTSEGISNSDHGLVNNELHKSTVIRQETCRNDILVASNMTYFKTVNSSHIVPKEKYYSGSDGVMEKREEYLSYDQLGNLVETVKDKHSSMVRLWSYNGMYPVAEIKNATYEQVRNALGELAELLPQLPSLSNMIWSNLNNLRSAPSLVNAMITTYRYRPLVGIVEMVDPRGISTYYNYDDHGRLIEVYILENGIKKLLQENKYKYYDEK